MTWTADKPLCKQIGHLWKRCSKTGRLFACKRCDRLGLEKIQ